MDNPLSLNLYTYTTNNPLRYVDPSGHEAGSVTWSTSNSLKDSADLGVLKPVGQLGIDFANAAWNTQGPGTGAVTAVKTTVQGGKTVVNNLVNVAKNMFKGKGNAGRIISSVDALSDFARSKITTSQMATLNQQGRTYSHLTEMDLKGAQRDLVGNPVPKPGGGYYDHAQEVSDAYRGLVDLQRSWIGVLKNPNLDTELRQLYTSKLNEVNASKNKIEDMFAPHGGVYPPK